MLRKTIVLLAFSISLSCSALAWWEDAWFDPAFLEAHTLAGGTGFILVPSPEVVPKGVTVGGLHRYKAKLGYGFWNFLELGGNVELEGWKLDDAEKNNQLSGRLAILRPAQQGFALAIGADQVGFEDLGFKNFGFVPKLNSEFEDRYYAMAGLVPSRLPMLYLAAGYLGSRRGGSAVGALGLVLIPGLLAIGEYDSVGTNVGLRGLLSTQIKMDLSVLRLQSIDTGRPFGRVLENNVRFGVSYSEAWP